MSDPIEAYLDELAEQMQVGGARRRRLLAETEDHLRESAAGLVAHGRSEEAAAAEAISRFGPAEAMAAGMRPSGGAVARDVLRAGWLLGGVGLMAIGVSGAVAELLFHVAGATFLAGDGLGVTYTPARCADFREYVPSAGSCAQAAAVHHAGEVVMWRVAAGVLGVAMLAVYRLHRTRARGDQRVLPRVAVPMTAATLFAAAGLVLLLDAVGLWLGQAAHGEVVAGVGDPLSGGIVATLSAAVAGAVTVRRLMNEPRRHDPVIPP